MGKNKKAAIIKYNLEWQGFDLFINGHFRAFALGGTYEARDHLTDIAESIGCTITYERVLKHA